MAYFINMDNGESGKDASDENEIIIDLNIKKPRKEEIYYTFNNVSDKSSVKDCGTDLHRERCTVIDKGKDCGSGPETYLPVLKKHLYEHSYASIFTNSDTEAPNSHSGGRCVEIRNVASESVIDDLVLGVEVDKSTNDSPKSLVENTENEVKAQKLEKQNNNKSIKAPRPSKLNSKRKRKDQSIFKGKSDYLLIRKVGCTYMRDYLTVQKVGCSYMRIDNTNKCRDHDSETGREKTIDTDASKEVEKTRILGESSLQDMIPAQSNDTQIDLQIDLHKLISTRISQGLSEDGLKQVRQYSCDVRSFKSSTRSLLDHHNYCADPDVPDTYNCAQCYFTTNRKELLNRHNRERHICRYGGEHNNCKNDYLTVQKVSCSYMGLANTNKCRDHYSETGREKTIDTDASKEVENMRILGERSLQDMNPAQSNDTQIDMPESARTSQGLSEDEASAGLKQIRQYSCDVRSFKSSTRSLLDHHNYCADPDVPDTYKCDQCYFTTNRKGLLNRHHREKHSYASICTNSDSEAPNSHSGGRCVEIRNVASESVVDDLVLGVEVDKSTNNLPKSLLENTENEVKAKKLKTQNNKKIINAARPSKLNSKRKQKIYKREQKDQSIFKGKSDCLVIRRVGCTYTRDYLTVQKVGCSYMRIDNTNKYRDRDSETGRKKTIDTDASKEVEKTRILGESSLQDMNPAQSNDTQIDLQIDLHKLISTRISQGLSEDGLEQVRQYSCDVHSFKSSTRSLLDHHNYCADPDVPDMYKCAQCYFITNSKELLNRHIREKAHLQIRV